MAKNSKLHIIDNETFERYNQYENEDVLIPIHNSQHAKTKIKFHLLSFLKPEKIRIKKTLYRNCCSHKFLHRPVKKKIHRGKIREGGKKKRHTKLKKTILKQRNINEHAGESSDKDVMVAAEMIENLTLTKTIENNVFSRRFREYCDNTTSPKLKELTESLLRSLDRFQKRAYSQNEYKARAHRRFVIGLNEVQSSLNISKIKLVIIAPDCETCHGPDGLDKIIENVKNECQQKNIPYLFSLKRRELGYVLYKKVPITCVGILDYDGAQNIFRDLLTCLNKEREMFQNIRTNSCKQSM